MTLALFYTNAFKKDFRRMEKRGKDLSKLHAVIQKLVNDEALPEILRDHALTQDWTGHRDLHIEPDWLLIYKKTEDSITVVRTGTHSDLF